MPANNYTPFSKQWIIADKTAVEAGYVNNSDDRGGETNCGITRSLAMEFKADLVKLYKWDGLMQHLTKEMAFYIYDQRFWKGMKLDDIMLRCPYLADKMFDIGINSGSKFCVIQLQTVLNVLNNKGAMYKDVDADGSMGGKTLGAIDSFLKARGNRKARWTLLKALICIQGANYINIPKNNESQETFTFGWLERLDHNLQTYMNALL